MAGYETRMNRRKGKQTVDVFKLDTQNKTPQENIIDILQGLYIKVYDASPTSKNVQPEVRGLFGFRGVQRSSSDTRRLSYLNSLVTLLSKEDSSNWGFTPDELMTCIRISLVDESVVIRAAALRVLRYLIKTENDVASFNILKLPYLVIRSLDLMLRNEEERAQALRVIRRVIAVVGTGNTRRHRAAYVEPGLLRCLVAIARAGSGVDGAGDRLARPAIATLAELGVINPAVFVSCGGVSAVTRYLSECTTPRMAEALCGVLLHTLNEPAVRRAARLDLRPLCAPYCDFYFKPTADSARDEREMRFTCSRLALLSVVRSWPGVLHLCHPYSAGGLRAIVQALHLPRLEVRKAILDLLYELLGLPQPEWTDEISVALGAVDPSDFQDNWRLNEGFVAEEGLSILPNLNAVGPDITDIHLALLLQCFLEAGLLDGLAEVIVTSDTFISVRATVLLGQLMHLIHLLLPPQICNVTPPLPSLIAHASAGKPQALAAIAALNKLQIMLQARPAANSLFLDHILQYCAGVFKEHSEDASKRRKEKDNAIMASPKPFHDANLYKDNSIDFLNESDAETVDRKQRHSVGSRADVGGRNVPALVKSKSVSSRTSAAVSRVAKSARFFSLFDSQPDSLLRASAVYDNKDGNAWNWELIRTMLKESDSPFLNLSDSSHRAWAHRIVSYLKPSSNKYSHGDLTLTGHGHAATRAGCQLIRHLLNHYDLESQKLLEDFFEDVSSQIAAIETGKKAHECLFSPQHMSNTMCQMYFLFIGQLCHSQNGLKLFKQTRLYENLLELSTKTHHSCYVKLVISSLDYTLDSYPREILAKTVTCNIQASRIYTTQFLNVLLRASQKSREIVRKKMKLRKGYQENRGREEEGNGDMETWLLQMLVGQVKDESKVVVKNVFQILLEAISVPSYLDKLISMRDKFRKNCRIDRTAEPSSFDLSVIGDHGYLIWLVLEAGALSHFNDTQTIEIIKKHLDYWTKSYNYRYVLVVESEMHGALTLQGGGRGGAVPPPHIHSTLVRGGTGTGTTGTGTGSTGTGTGTTGSTGSGTGTSNGNLLRHHLAIHYKIIKLARCSNEQEIMDLKASLWALGNTATSAQGVQLLMQLTNGALDDSVPVLIVRLAKYCPVYSIRAAAFFNLGLIGTTYVGANLLNDLGWLCVRHSRHENFPILEEDNISSSIEITGNKHHLITSPNRRYIPRPYDIEISEHSDHTDQSTVESLHSDQTKQSGSKIVVTIEKDKDTVDYPTNYTTREIDKRKSHTLPSQGGYVHERPMTESRTVDILRDYTSYERTGQIPGTIAENRLMIGRVNSLDTHEGRVRNTSESSTSGVSSCDSVLGRYAFPDRILTLSPIPSSSSIYGMKNSSQRPRLADTQRRTSASSFSAAEAASSPPSQRDMVGYATLKSLNRNRRPHLSESAASGSNEDLSWILNESSRRSSKPFSSLRDRGKTTRERLAKISVLSLDWKPLVSGETETRWRTCRTWETRSDVTTHHPGGNYGGMTYRGITLPHNILDLFPRGEGDEATLDSFAGDTSFLLDTTTTSDTKVTSPDNINASFSKAGPSTSPDGRWRHTPTNCIGCVRTRPPSSHQLREAFFASPETSKDGGSGDAEVDLSPYNELLHQAHYMANPIHHKQTRCALITLKQRHPEVFRSACAYSEVSALLCTGTYIMCARRFLQELFLDAPFDCFTSEPAVILARRMPIKESTTPPHEINPPPT